MDRKCIDAEDCDQHEDKGDIHTYPVPGGQAFVRHNETYRSHGNDDLKIPDLEESLSVLKEQGNGVSILSHGAQP
jgi:hypothetical protein